MKMHIAMSVLAVVLLGAGSLHAAEAISLDDEMFENVRFGIARSA